MNEQHPDSGKGSGTSDSGKSKPDELTSPSDAVKISPSGRRITRKLGRPPVGKPEQVRLSEAEREIALHLGNGVLAKGVRVALQRADLSHGSDGDSEGAAVLGSLRAIWRAEHPNAVTGPSGADLLAQAKSLKTATQQRSSDQALLSPEAAAFAGELGEGDLYEGIRIALAAAQFLGVETSRKMAHNGTDSTRKRR